MPAILNRMAAGIPGEVSRSGAALESNLLGASDIPYGAPVKMSSGLIVPLAASDTAAVIYGFLARSFPSQSAASEFGSGAAPAKTLQSVLRSGYMTVTLANGAAVRGGQVYVRVTAASGKNVGDIETAADSGKAVAIAGCLFMGPADESGNVEISYNI
jgi:hypothetical protein